MTDVRVEPATTEDVEALADLWVDLIRGQRRYGTHLLAESNRTAAGEFLAQYVAADRLFVARSPAGILGFVMFHVSTGAYEQDTDRGTIDNVYVRPDFRGDGVGSRLLDAAEDALADAGVGTLSLSVLAANEGARRLYERRGYRPHRIEMERPIDPENDTHSREDA